MKTRTPRCVAELLPGEQGIVARINPHGPSGQRLLAMGFLPGCPLRFLRQAPLGDPVMLEVRGCILCLRRCDANLVELEDAA